MAVRPGTSWNASFGREERFLVWAISTARRCLSQAAEGRVSSGAGVDSEMTASQSRVYKGNCSVSWRLWRYAEDRTRRPLGGDSPAQHSVTDCAIILWTAGA